jgi:hypothetical protein
MMTCCCFSFHRSRGLKHELSRCINELGDISTCLKKPTTVHRVLTGPLLCVLNACAPDNQCLNAGA